MKRILIIDDNTWERELFKDILEQAGYEVFEAPDGNVGMRLHRQNPCDLVVTDIYMPEKDGLEILQELKQKFPSLPIIVVSAGGERALRLGGFEVEFVLTAAKQFGADRALQKPVGRQKLLAVVEELLKNTSNTNGL
jgi:DNA-binding response OmpR family regulator